MWLPCLSLGCRLHLALGPCTHRLPQMALGPPRYLDGRIRGSGQSAGFLPLCLPGPGWTSHRPRSSPQAYKFLYASRLADFGLASQALHYCEAVGTALLSQGESSHPVLLVELIKVSFCKGPPRLLYLQRSE